MASPQKSRSNFIRLNRARYASSTSGEAGPLNDNS